MTYDASQQPPTQSDGQAQVHFNCGLETLTSTLLLKREAMKSVDFLDVVKVDLSKVREWLFGGQTKVDR